MKKEQEGHISTAGFGCHRRNALFVAAQVPDPTTSHGDYRSFLLLRLMGALTNAFLLPLTRTAGRRRYAEQLETLRVTAVAPPPTEGVGYFPALLARYKIDVVIFERYSVAVPFLLLPLPTTRRIIDAVELHFRKSESMAALTQDPSHRLLAQEVKRKELIAYRLADTVVTINEYEKRILSSCVDRRKIVALPTGLEDIPELRQQSRGKDIVFFGCFHHAPNVDAAAFFLRDIFPLVKGGLGKVQCVFAGYGAREKLGAVAAGKGVVIRDRVENVVDYLRDFRVFVCPLRYGAGTKKKILDAMAAGVPVVATTAGVEGMGLACGREVLIADTAAAFAESIARLYSDERLRSGIVRNAYRHVSSSYTVGKMQEKLKEIIVPS